MIRLKELRRLSPIQTPSTIRVHLERLGITQVQAAELLHVDPRTMRRWLAPEDSPGHAPMPFSAFALLQLLKKDNAR